MRAVGLIDGDHTPAVVRHALSELPYEWLGVVLAGGSEKLLAEDGYGVPLVEGFGDAEIVVDLSDEPTLGPEQRFLWASRALAAGLPYVGAGFRFDPPALEPIDVPSIAVIGTGKRVGKTALTAHLAQLAARSRSVVVVTMGRGGPPEPETVETPPTIADLVALARTGRHAASDHLELAALCNVPTIGCRRAGGGLAGDVLVSNVAEGARLAAERQPELVIFDGSGTAIPPVAVDRRILVVGPGHDLDTYFNPYRRLISDLVVAVGCELPGAVSATLRLRPAAELPGRVAVFTAGPSDVSHLDADIVHVSRNLGNRSELVRELRDIEADTYLTEIKGAAIDVVAEDGLARDRHIVAAGNDVIAPGLDEALLALNPEAVGV